LATYTPRVVGGLTSSVTLTLAVAAVQSEASTSAPGSRRAADGR
jgi:hypothetical protein